MMDVSYCDAVIVTEIHCNKSSTLFSYKWDASPEMGMWLRQRTKPPFVIWSLRLDVEILVDYIINVDHGTKKAKQ